VWVRGRSRGQTSMSSLRILPSRNLHMFNNSETPWSLSLGFVCLLVFFFFPLCFYGSFITWTWLIKSLAIGDQLITGASKQLLSQKH
jgi:hypothetical protein